MVNLLDKSVFAHEDELIIQEEIAPAQEVEEIQETSVISKNKKNILLSLAILLPILFVALIATNQPQSKTITKTQPQSVLSEQIEVKSKKIAYINSGNIWIMKEDGTGKKKLTQDGGGTGYNYNAVEWLDDKVIYFSKCLNRKCSINSINIENDQSEVIVPNITADDIFDISMNLSKSNVIYQKSYNQKLTIVLNNSAEDKVIVEKNLSDNPLFEIILSPNNDRFVLLNKNKFEGEDSAVVYSINGDEISIIPTKTLSVYFIDNNNLAYLYQDKLYRKSISSGESIVILNYVEADAIVTLTGFEKYLYVTINPDTDTLNTSIYNLNTGEQWNLITNIKSIRWINENSLAYIDSNDNLYKINSDNTGKYLLTDGIITSYSISN